MRFRSPIAQGMAIAALFGCVLPESVWGATIAEPKAVTTDVALQDGGLLIGQIVDSQGKALLNAPVSLRYQQHEIAATKSGPSGYFAVRGLRGGVYQIVTAEGQGVYRLWTPGAAPPSAQQGALVVVGSETLRGQWSAGALKFYLTDPCVLTALAIGAAAVAIPVAIHNADRHRPASP